MEIKAQLNNLRMSPRKVRLVADLVRGKDVDHASLQLIALPKRSSEQILKLIKSAVANARHNFSIEGGLYVKQIFVNGGAVMKRQMPRAFGRAATIRKRTSNISLVLGTRE